LFRSVWQVICHVNDIPRPGDYYTLKFLDENVAAVRGDDGQVRCFHNVCRHRASILLQQNAGNCGHRVVCPYHAWSYGLDGRLTNPPKGQGFDGLDKAKHGLPPVETETYEGFIFVRFESGGPSVAEMMAPYADEIATFNLPALIPNGRVTLRPRGVNWKNV